MGRKYLKGKYLIGSIGLRGWDYINKGNYSITIKTSHRGNIFRRISNDEMFLNGKGKIADLHTTGTNMKKKIKNILPPQT